MVDPLLARLRALIGTQDLGNGTPLAEATFDAILLESAAENTQPVDITSLTNEQLRAASDAVRAHLNNERHPPRQLVFGTQLTSVQGLNIGEKVYRPDAARPGLFAFSSLSGEVTGPNLSKLMSMLEALSTEYPFDQFGDPLVGMAHGGGARHYLEFRPRRASSRTIMKQRVSDSHYPPFCSWMPHHFAEFISNTSHHLNMLLSRRGEIAERALQIETAWNAALRDWPIVELSNVSIDWEEDVGEDAEYPYMFAEYRGLNSRLEQSTILVDVSGHAELDQQFFHWELQDQTRRERRRKVLENLGAFALIDGVAASIIRSSHEGEESLVGRILDEGWVNFDFTDYGAIRDSYLMWLSGRIEVCITSRTYRLTSQEFAIRVNLPTSVLLACHGRKLASVVQLPFPIDAEISDVRRNRDGWISFMIKEASYLIDLKTKKIGSIEVEV